ncbi:hypothetical protein Hanom_Chr12g01085921 [Helianthus anomalus]
MKLSPYIVGLQPLKHICTSCKEVILFGSRWFCNSCVPARPADTNAAPKTRARVRHFVFFPVFLCASSFFSCFSARLSSVFFKYILAFNTGPLSVLMMSVKNNTQCKALHGELALEVAEGYVQ